MDSRPRTRTGGTEENLWYAKKLRECAESGNLGQGRAIHSQLASTRLRNDRYLSNLLIDMYGKCGSLGEAQEVFEAIPNPNLTTWNILISAYALNGRLDRARETFDGLRQRNSVSWNTIISAYTQNGELHRARELFDRMPEKNQVSWNAMISAHSERGDVAGAESLFEKMPERNVISWAAMLACYTRSGSLRQAQELFVKMPERNVVAWTTMILAYARARRVEQAREMFDRMPKRNVITWTTMIGAYGRSSRPGEAFRLFGLMDLEGVQPNSVTFIEVADSCASSSCPPSPARARVLHSLLEETYHNTDLLVATAMINLHGRCGCLREAGELFDGVSERDLVLWTAMITAFAHNGHRARALELFQTMELQGIQPNEITYINVLAGAANAGLVEDSWTYFTSMVGDFWIAPMIEHFVGVIQALGRAGRLAQAEELVISMPFEADHVSWMTLLSSCETHLDVERAIRAAEEASLLDPGLPAPYVVLANIYSAASGDEVSREKLRGALERLRRRAGAVKA